MIDFKIQRDIRFPLKTIIEYLNYEGYCQIDLERSDCPFCFDPQTECTGVFLERNEYMCVACKKVWYEYCDNNELFTKKPNNCEKCFEFCDECPAFDAFFGSCND